MLDAEARKTAKAVRWCNWVGMPTTMDVGRRSMSGGAREVVIVAESPVTPVRHLYLNRKTHIDKDTFNPTTSGDSIAHWEGDTLVVDTIGFDPNKGITEIPGGGFRTAELASGRTLSADQRWRAAFRAVHLDRSVRVSDASHVRVPLSARGKRDEPRPVAGVRPLDKDYAAFHEQKR